MSCFGIFLDLKFTFLGLFRELQQSVFHSELVLIIFLFVSWCGQSVQVGKPFRQSLMGETPKTALPHHTAALVSVVQVFSPLRHKDTKRSNRKGFESFGSEFEPR